MALEDTTDYFQLKEEGIKWLERLTGNLWTDYNVHDPGITVLEQLCVALAQLSSLTDLEVQDLLQQEDDRKKSVHLLERAEKIFPCNALTVSDYRKLIFDEIFEVKNVWIYPLGKEEQPLSGLYRIVLDVEDSFKAIEGGSKLVEDKARNVFCSNRNMGEDVAEIKVLEDLTIDLNVEIEIDGTQSIEDVLSETYFEVDRFLRPEISVYSLEEMLDSGISPADLYIGCALKHGFIKEEELRPKTSRILISDIAKIITQVEGVNSVKNLTLTVDGELVTSHLSIDLYKVPRLLTEVKHTDGKPSIIFTRGGNVSHATLDEELVRRKLNKLRASSRRIFRTGDSEENNKIPGTYVDVAKYDTIQNDFPAVYGIGKAGVPSPVTIERKAKAKQLKGFLLFFEQIMANYLAQLGGIKQLFSIEDFSESYFFQTLDNIPKVDELYRQSDNWVDNEVLGRKNFKADYREGLPQLLKGQDDVVDRRNRLLDWVLALHGEVFIEYAISQYNYYLEDEEFLRRLIGYKMDFLKNLPVISKNRGKAGNYLGDTSNRMNLSGLEFRLKALLGLGKIQEGTVNLKLLSLGENKGVKLSADADKAEKWNELSVLDKSIVKSINDTFDYIDEEDFDIKEIDEAKRKELLSTTLPFQAQTLTTDYLTKSIDLESYRIGEQGDTYTLVFTFDSEDETTEDWIKIGTYSSWEEASLTAMVLCDEMKEINIEYEGLHVVENVLLRAEPEENKFGIFLLDEYGNHLLASNEIYTFEERKEVLKAIKDEFYKPDNYSVEALDGQLFEIRFQTSDEKIKFTSLKKYDSAKGVYKLQEELRDFLSDKYEIVNFERKIGSYIQHADGAHILPEDFFSFNVNLFLPNWTARFSSLEFRSIVEETVFKNQPAHVLTQCNWVTVDEMEQFENLYFGWKELKAKGIGIESQEMQKATLELTELIATLTKSGYKRG